MLVFTKTCARDAERVAYQALAVARLGWGHILLVERDERDAIEAMLDAKRARRRVAPSLRNPRRERYERILALEDHMPEAMEISNPYLRQQYCKMIAPTLWGDMLQLDSDMCPIVGGGFDLSSLTAWWFDSDPTGHREQVVYEWARAYEILLGGSALLYDFMGPAKGWYITAELARTFRLMVSTVARVDLLSAVSDLWRLATISSAGEAKLFDAMFGGGLKVSEYHLLGTFAYKFMRSSYLWIDAPQPAWCHHFTSSEPLTPQQRQLLEEAAHG